MPVYIRKNISYTPPSLDNFEGEDNDDDFITDPEQIRDTLPQPYRMLDKVLRNILDDVWETIATRESEHLAECNRIRPPRYECSIQMKSLAKATCMTNTEDGQFVFVGLPTGLAALESSSQRISAVWEEEGAEIVQMNSSQLSADMYLISTVDDMGKARLFAYSADTFYFLKLLNEQDVSSNKIIASHCESSQQGDYVGVVLESPGSSSPWLEVHRLPKEAWIKELESLLPKKEPSGGQADQPSATVQQGETPAASMETSEDAENVTTENTDLKADTLQPTLPLGVAVTESTLASVKFSLPTLILKVKCPTEPAGSAGGGLTIYQACKAAGCPEVIGTGTQHLVSQQHLDQRHIVFQQCHEEVKGHASREHDKSHSPSPQPTFHFLTASRLMSVGTEQPGQADRCLGLAVWWSGSTQMYHYALVKGSKDLEYKPDIVWPCSACIRCSAVTPCTSLMAVGLTNGNILIWDLYIGVQRGVMDVSSSPPKELHFLDPSLCPQDEACVSVFGKKTMFYLLVLCEDSSVYLKRCGGALSEASKPVTLSHSGEEGEEITFLKPLSSVPRLILQVLRNGSMFIQDVVSGHMICQVVLPQSHDLVTPWQPVLAVGGGGKMLYVKGEPAESSPRSVEDTSPVVEKSVFVVQLRSFPTLDKFWQMDKPDVPFLMPSTASTQVDVLLRLRLSQQADRKSRLEQRWSEYTKQLEMIKGERTKRRLASAKSSFGASVRG